ncbi:uncharacterized protein LOC126659891 [Mercurialis annua]|uniref:uncharacterized protein LOC126659891 n=1 Tax=Mercurialis annua TaxID=3986 RepID=UPI00216085F3|nr:uncharacterized protein LOC126659891 [Mercurialis annua]XP_050209170.1 uncharacterized protein LOC126659891 [Mercurialis annua]XP_050209171.1 uncharacterized protein LOC126659891 [Mercurialis annua]
MNEFGSERSKGWNIYTSSESSSSSQIEQEGPWKNLGTSMNAVAFGFVATAILISMFLIMAIFEHLFRPNPSFSSPTAANESLESGHKLPNPHTVRKTSYASDYSVVMPGEKFATFIAHPAPLPIPSCSREGISWPSHDHHNLV